MKGERKEIMKKGERTELIKDEIAGLCSVGINNSTEFAMPCGWSEPPHAVHVVLVLNRHRHVRNDTSCRRLVAVRNNTKLSQSSLVL